MVFQLGPALFEIDLLSGAAQGLNAEVPSPTTTSRRNLLVRDHYGGLQLIEGRRLAPHFQYTYIHLVRGRDPLRGILHSVAVWGLGNL